MAKVALGGVVLALCAALYLHSRDSAAAGVRGCMQRAGATVRKSERFAQAFPYLEAAASGKRVQGHPEFKGASVYAVMHGNEQGLLFVGNSEGDARAFERAVRLFDLGHETRSRYAENVMLLWLRPPATAFDPVGDCVR
jgi:hypothetical protein